MSVSRDVFLKFTFKNWNFCLLGCAIHTLYTTHRARTPTVPSVAFFAMLEGRKRRAAIRRLTFGGSAGRFRSGLSAAMLAATAIPEATFTREERNSARAVNLDNENP